LPCKAVIRRAQPESRWRNSSANKAAVIFVGLISGATSTADAEIPAGAA